MTAAVEGTPAPLDVLPGLADQGAQRAAYGVPQSEVGGLEEAAVVRVAVREC